MSIISASDYRKTINPVVKEDIKSLSDKQLLTYLLSFCVSPETAKAYAKKLFARFGSLLNILHAETQDLMSCDLPESAAVMIRLSIMRHYISARETVRQSCLFDTAEKAGTFFIKLFAGLSYERLYMLMLNKKYEYIGLSLLSEGVVNNLAFQNRMIVEQAVKNRASIIILAHNHPFGDPEASDVDMSSTNEIDRSCQMVGITLAEHLVIADAEWYPIILYSKILPLAVPSSFYSESLLAKAESERIKL